MQPGQNSMDLDLEQRANDSEYVPVAISCIPESVSPASINAENRKYWEAPTGE